MKPTNRRDVLAAGEIQVVDCINRCVRRAYLYGQDLLTGTDYEHRRELIRQRLEFLAGIMGIEVLGYSIIRQYESSRVLVPAMASSSTRSNAAKSSSFVKIGIRAFARFST